ncbi:Alpha-ketoglutarate-dependent dioxygenase AlkB [Burkholderiales bacterium 8X]|nr:Alpha-ketoglutarate-dependent dioxygenase AlkB [Burkholderiales bacterium 8X]
MSELFPSDPALLTVLPIPGAEVEYLRRFDCGPAGADALMQQLIDEVPWRAEKVKVWGKEHLQPRLIAWYGDPGSSYTYSGLTMEPMAWTEALHDLKLRVEATAGKRFNSVLLNLYRSGRDRMGFHSDDEDELGARPVIASLSLGATRTFVMKPRRDSSAPVVRLKLESGSLLIMRGDTQRNWKHGVPATTSDVGARVNLTFRWIGR